MEDLTFRVLMRTLVLPPAGPMLLALCGFLLMRSRRHARLGMGIALSGVVALLVLSVPLISGGLARWLESGYSALDLSQPLDADAVVILAGGVRRDAPEYGEAAPNDTTLQRLAYGVRVARASRLPILVTGAWPEAAAMAELLRRDFQLPPRWVEHRARNTEQNATRSAAMLKPEGVKRIVLVTSAMHMRRAVAEFESTGLEVIPAPTGLHGSFQYRADGWLPSISGLRDSHYVLYEVLGDIVRRLR